jgi:hypothetical protein
LKSFQFLLYLFWKRAFCSFWKNFFSIVISAGDGQRKAAPIERRTLESGQLKNLVHPLVCSDEESVSASENICCKPSSGSDCSEKIHDEPRTTLTSGNIMNY